jgi:hypothetical protein
MLKGLLVHSCTQCGLDEVKLLTGSPTAGQQRDRP